uniref:MYND-type domain-containing protein n=1 Tax=Meloidogyne javanica TaxID=6303 RepID=A0A915LZ92_MELJA
MESSSSSTKLDFYPFAYALFDECLEKHCWYCLDDEKKLKRCTGCQNAMFCDKNCQSLGWKDHKFECKGIKLNKGQVPDIEVRLLGRIVSRHKAILCGVDKKDPDFYKDRLSKRKIMEIWAHTERIKNDEYAMRKFEGIYERLCRFYDPKAMLNKQEIGKGLYLDLCAYDHSCRPNTVYSCHSFIATLRSLDSKVNLLDYSSTFYSYIDLLCAKQDRRKLLKENCLRLCYPHNHPALAFHLRNIGIFAKKLGQRQKALNYLGEALGMFEFVMGEEHSLYKITEEIIEEVKKELPEEGNEGRSEERIVGKTGNEGKKVLEGERKRERGEDNEEGGKKEETEAKIENEAKQEGEAKLETEAIIEETEADQEECRYCLNNTKDGGGVKKKLLQKKSVPRASTPMYCNNVWGGNKEENKEIEEGEKEEEEDSSIRAEESGKKEKKGEKWDSLGESATTAMEGKKQKEEEDCFIKVEESVIDAVIFLDKSEDKKEEMLRLKIVLI